MSDEYVTHSSATYRGVRQRSNGKWVTETTDPNTKTRYWLGTYETAEMAALAYDSAVLYFHGSNARLNFPQFATALPQPATSSKGDVTKAANDASKLLVVAEEPSISHSHHNSHIQLSPTQIQAIRDSPFYW